MPKIYGNLQPPAKSSWRWLSVSLRLIAVCSSAAACLYAIFFGPFFRVTSVSVTGTEFSSARLASSAVPIGSNIWLVSTSLIRSQISSDPAVSSVTVLRGLPHTVKINITEQPPALLWQTGETVAVVNDQGSIFKLQPVADLAAEPLADLRAKVPVVEDSQNLPVQLGEALLSPQFIGFVQTIQQKLPTIVPSLTIDHYLVVSSTYEVTLLTKQGLTVQFSVVSDPMVELRNLQRLIQQEKLPNNAQVDLRVNRWAYVHE